ncbi:hypothetical protein ACTFIW_002297 [Dictyostelium discoideum]
MKEIKFNIQYILIILIISINIFVKSQNSSTVQYVQWDNLPSSGFDITLISGSTILFVVSNKTGDHNVYSKETPPGVEKFSSGTLNFRNNPSFSHKFNDIGDYLIIDQINKTSGEMKLSIISNSSSEFINPNSTSSDSSSSLSSSISNPNSTSNETTTSTNYNHTTSTITEAPSGNDASTISTVIHSIEIGKVEILPNSLIGIDEDGVIQHMKSNYEDLKQLEKDVTMICTDNGINEQESVIDMGNKFLIPGFIDTHAHAPQYHNAGTGTDLPLLKWLEKYTFPVESKFKDLVFAENVYGKVVDRMLRHGTTTCCYYATIHLEASELLAEIVSKRGQRAFIGKVCMDRHSPDHYVETTEQSISNTKEFVDRILAKGNPLVQPIVTPRFAPSCTDELMAALGKLSHEKQTLIQSHLSENKDEIEWVKSLYPGIESYTHVYKHFNLLNERTIMAHCVHLSDEEIKLISTQQTAISHCPISNFTLSSGNLDVRKVLEANIKLGLGSDISGGYHPSILQVIRDSIKCSNSHFFNNDNHTPLTFEEAFYLATVGGSKVVNLDHRIGNFIVGKDFDAQIIDPFVQNSPFDCFDGETLKDIFQKFIYLGDDRNLSSLYIKGNKIKF